MWRIVMQIFYKASEYPLFIHIKFDHSHKINRQDYKRYKKVSQETKDAFVAMFDEDVNPFVTLEKPRIDIQVSFPDD